MAQPTTRMPGSVAPWRQSLSRVVETGARKFTDWLIVHWLGLLNWVLGAVLALAILTPILAYLGFDQLAGTIFRSYHAICEQVPSHSFYIFGHQMALCARNFSLYFAIWAGTMIFRFVRFRIRPLHWSLAVLLMLPMALDGGTQLFGWRESNPPLRIITGLLFGLGVCWFALPFVQEAVNESAPVLNGEVQIAGAQVRATAR